MCALVTGVQTCALPIFKLKAVARHRGKQQSDIDLAAPKRGWLRRARHLEQLQFHGRALLAMRSEDGRECRSGCALADAEPQLAAATGRSEEHTSELQSLMRISYAVFCLKKNKKKQ